MEALGEVLLTAQRLGRASMLPEVETELMVVVGAEMVVLLRVLPLEPVRILVWVELLSAS
jgi:hypothetical protein